MESEDRRRQILDLLDRQGACSYAELAELLSVSNMTVRRDVEKLVQEGLAIKTLGGIQRAAAPASFYESALQSRLTVQREEKRAIGLAALEGITSGQTIFLDGSTTCLELAKLLAIKRRGVTVVTNSALVCVEVGRTEDNRVIGIGGQYDPGSFCFVGPTSEEEARRFFVDVAFFSTKGFLPAEGTYESSVATFRIKQIVAEQCAAVTLLVDHTKFGKRALCKVLDISKIHAVITDGQAPEADVATLRGLGKTVQIAATKGVNPEVVSHAP